MSECVSKLAPPTCEEVDDIWVVLDDAFEDIEGAEHLLAELVLEARIAEHDAAHGQVERASREDEADELPAGPHRFALGEGALRVSEVGEDPLVLGLLGARVVVGVLPELVMRERDLQVEPVLIFRVEYPNSH